MVIYTRHRRRQSDGAIFTDAMMRYKKSGYVPLRNIKLA
jgi:hypothetical protein